MKRKPKYDFKQALIESGVNEDLAEDYLQVRKEKKGVNTKTAFNMLKAQIEKTNYTFESIIRLCTFKSWVGFSASWLKSLTKEELEFLEFKGMSEYELQQLKRNEAIKVEREQWGTSYKRKI